MTILVVNGYRDGFEGPNTVYIGRPGRGKPGSPLANPELLVSETDRAANIIRYRDWLWPRLYSDTPQRREILHLINLEERFGTIKLACFCAPKLCHGDIIAQYMRFYVQNGKW